MGCSQAKQTEQRNESPLPTVLRVEIRKGGMFKVEFGNPIIIYVSTKQSVTLSEAGIAYVTPAPPPFPVGWHEADINNSASANKAAGLDQSSVDVMFQPSAVRSAIESVILFTYVDYNTIGIPYPIEGCLYIICSTPLNYAIYSTDRHFGIRQLQTTTVSRTPTSLQPTRFNPIGRSAPVDIPPRSTVQRTVPQQSPPMIDPTHTPPNLSHIHPDSKHIQLDSKHIQPDSKHIHPDPSYTTPSAPPIYQQSAPELHYRPIYAADQNINNYLDAQLGESDYQPGNT